VALRHSLRPRVRWPAVPIPVFYAYKSLIYNVYQESLLVYVSAETRARSDRKGRRYFNCLTFRPIASGESMLRLCRRGACLVNCCEAYPTSQFAQKFALKSGGNGIRAAITLTANVNHLPSVADVDPVDPVNVLPSVLQALLRLARWPGYRGFLNPQMYSSIVTFIQSLRETLWLLCTISRNGPARFRVNGPTLHGLPAEPRFGSFTRPFSSRQVFWL
jgi:hypothetical protein